MTKSEIRRQIKNLRLMLSDMEKESAAAEVFDRLEKTAAFLMSERVLMYHSLPDELSTCRASTASTSRSSPMTSRASNSGPSISKNRPAANSPTPIRWI